MNLDKTNIFTSKASLLEDELLNIITNRHLLLKNNEEEVEVGILEEDYDSKAIFIRHGYLFSHSASVDNKEYAFYYLTKNRLKSLKNKKKKINTSFTKIIVLGPPCAGKSYISKLLADHFHLPTYHLDVLYWKENWTPTPRDEFIKIQEKILKQDKWIMDGSYISTLEYRLEKADTIILLDYQSEECIANEPIRRGTKREDLPSYLKEEYDPSFIEYIKSYPEGPMKIIKAYLSLYPNLKTIVLHNRQEMEKFLTELND